MTMTFHALRPAAVAFAVLFALTVPVGPALSNGSLAIGLPNDVAEGGFAMGISYNYGTDGEADAESLKQCLSFMDAPDSTRALCKIFDHFKHECIAVAMDPEPGTYGVGWKIADTQSQADDGAMSECKRTSNDDRDGYCQITYRICDKSP